MKFAGRINAIMPAGGSVLDSINLYRSMPGITHLEFNYPEHFSTCEIQQIRDAIGDMPVNGVEMRFKSDFVGGEFTNPDPAIQKKAIDLVKGAVDACRAIGGEYVTVWQAFDGYDYAFQMDYEKKWEEMIAAFQEIADYAGDIKISLEYKPFDPRGYAMVDSLGVTLMALEEIDRLNMGMTLDFCHLLMKHEGPSFALSMAAKKGKLFGLHLNDGYGGRDSCMIFGSVNLIQSLEFIYYLKRYTYDGAIFFDTVPFREDPIQELQANIETVNKLDALLTSDRMEYIEKNILPFQDGVRAQRFILDLLREL